jgi:RNA-binding protein YhbY
MKHTWNQLTLRPLVKVRLVEQTDAEERRQAQRAQAIRARANRLYMVGEMALAAQLLMELEMQPSCA